MPAFRMLQRLVLIIFYLVNEPTLQGVKVLYKSWGEVLRSLIRLIHNPTKKLLYLLAF